MNPRTTHSGRRSSNLHLPPINTSFDDALRSPSPASFKRLRPFPGQTPQTSLDDPVAVPLVVPVPNDPSSKLRKSKSFISNLFSRPNVERARGYNEPDVPAFPILSSGAPRRVPSNTNRAATRTYSLQTEGQSKESHTAIRAYSMQTGILWNKSKTATRANSMQTVKAYGLKSPTSEPPQMRSKPSSTSLKLKTTKQARSLGHRVEAPWDPPPLFQAYPQAVKHSILQDPELSSDTTSSGKREKKDQIGTKSRSNSSLGFRRSRSRARGQTPRFVADTEKQIWNEGIGRKIYVLVTSGYLLQYTGDGLSDRLPEKILKLGQDSAAFASDLISGKHWVLQVVQDSQKPIVRHKSFLSRLGFHGARARATTSGLLLIFDSGSEMENWMTVIRKEIEQMGGPPPKPQIRSRTFSDDSINPPPVTHRYMMITRNPSLSSNLPSPIPSELTATSPTLIGSERVSSNTAIGTSSDWSSKRSSTQQYPGRFSSLQKLSITTVIDPSDNGCETHDDGYSPSSPKFSMARTSLSASPQSDGNLQMVLQEALEPAIATRLPFISPKVASVNRRKSLPTLPPTQEGEPLQIASQSSLQRRTTLTTANRTLQLQQHQPMATTTGYRSWSASRTPIRQSTTTARQLRSGTAPSPIFNGNPSGMESISESTLDHSQSRQRDPPIYKSDGPAGNAFALGLLRSDSTPFRSSSQISLTRLSSITSSAKNSVRSSVRNAKAPLPFRASTMHSYSPPLTADWSATSSSRSSSSTLQLHTSISRPSLSPISRSGSPNPSATATPLKRPATLPVNTDPAPFLSSVRNGARSPRLRYSPSPRPSVLVPIIRPATIGPGLRTRQSAPLLRHSPPSRPPDVPLPSIPMQVAV